ncbi:MAG: hypothetical protein ACI977_000871 [Candidatus Nanohaloarchaea archaeon]|jgi:hypothetical protein
MVSVEIAVAIIAWAGIIVSYFTMESFNLRQWKDALRYLFHGFIVFFIYKAVAANPLVGEIGIVGAGFKVVFICLILYGVYKIRETAKLVGY